MKRKFDEIKILVTRNIPVLGVEMLRKEGFSVTAWPHERPMTDRELITEGKKHNVILCVSADNIGTDFINTCSHLEMISQFAVGYDNIDVALATKLEIPIGYAPGAMNEATADIAFGLMIAVGNAPPAHCAQVLEDILATRLASELPAAATTSTRCELL